MNPIKEATSKQVLDRVEAAMPDGWGMTSAGRRAVIGELNEIKCGRNRARSLDLFVKRMVECIWAAEGFFCERVPYRSPNPNYRPSKDSK